MNHPRGTKTHIACTCALPLPTSHPHASLGRGGGGAVCVYVCVCQGNNSNLAQTARFTFLLPTTTANHQFGVRPCRGGSPKRLMIPICTGCCQHTAAPGPVTPPHSTKTHIACTCALPLPTAQPHASLWTSQLGGGGVSLQATVFLSGNEGRHALACLPCWPLRCRHPANHRCVCAAQIFQIMLKLRGSTMMRRNHEFCCSVALSPGFRNWVEMTRKMCVCVCVCANCQLPRHGGGFSCNQFSPVCVCVWCV